MPGPADGQLAAVYLAGFPLGQQGPAGASSGGQAGTLHTRDSDLAAELAARLFIHTFQGEEFIEGPDGGQRCDHIWAWCIYFGSICGQSDKYLAE